MPSDPQLAHGGDLTHRIIGLAMKVHTALGPGLLESVYTDCLCHELRRAGLPFTREQALAVTYDGIELGDGHRADIIVAGTVVVEIKAVEHLLPVHAAQTLTYLRLSHCPIGLLLNFNCASLKDGIRRFVN